jgi:hypothetical protein
MKRDDPKVPRKPNDVAEQLKELLQLRRKVRAAEMAASSHSRRPEAPTARAAEQGPTVPSDSNRKFRG